MITPRLFEKSLTRSLQWRLLLVWWASLLLPGAIAALPMLRFLQRHLDHTTSALDGAAFLQLTRQLHEDGAAASIELGLAGGLLAVVFGSPFVAGAMVAAARSDEPPQLSRLLSGAGEYYGRMLRTLLVGAIPLGLAAAVAAGTFKLAEHAVERAALESTALRHVLVASAVSAAALFVCGLLLDGARARFAAEPGRQSALLAVWSAAGLLARRPLRMLGIGALGMLVGLGGAAAFMALRSRVEPVALAWVLAQGAHLAVGWGRGARIFGLTDLSRADTAKRGNTQVSVSPNRPPALAASR
ncbi:MAG: hypothetical protein ABR567_16945 [Myxococcales bacterium]